MERSDADLIAAIKKGDSASFEVLLNRHLPRVFSTARRYARRESEVEDIVQEVWIRVHQKLDGFRGEAPFEHWLMRMAVRVCYDFLRSHKRNREATFADLNEDECNWVERASMDPHWSENNSSSAKELVDKVLEKLSPSARLVITLLEIEEKSTREIAEITGWSVALVKVRAFRARAEMRKWIKKLPVTKY